MPTELIFTDHDFQTVNRIRNLPAPQNSDEPARKAELDAAIQGLAWKDNVRVATQGNINLAAPGATVDGIALTSGDVVDGSVLVRAQTAPAENGIYVWNGAAAAMTRRPDADNAQELESAVVTVDEGTSAGVTYRQSSVNFVLGTNAVTWGNFGTAAGNASTSSPGIAALATQSEVDTGTETAKIVTPATLAGAANRKRKSATVIGDASATQFDISHNFNTRDVQVEVYRNATPWDTVGVLVSRPDANTVRVNMNPAPASNAYTVVILG